MNNEIGNKVYKYTVKNGKFFVHEGVIRMRGGRKCVYFESNRSWENCPEETDYGGIITSSSQAFWLTERDDEVAKALFIRTEQLEIAKLNKQIERKLQLINKLQDGV